jgi:hypothetical protein
LVTLLTGDLGEFHSKVSFYDLRTQVANGKSQPSICCHFLLGLLLARQPKRK